jgi:hypothetical protein
MIMQTLMIMQALPVVWVRLVWQSDCGSSQPAVGVRTVLSDVGMQMQPALPALHAVEVPQWPRRFGMDNMPQAVRGSDLFNSRWHRVRAVYTFAEVAWRRTM